MYDLGAQTKAAGNDKCGRGVLERPKQRGIIVFRGDEIRGIKAAAASEEEGCMHCIRSLFLPIQSLRGVGLVTG